jgi:beta-galactosidase
VRDTATTRFFFNYGPKPVTWKDTIIPAAGVHWEAL